MIMLRSGATSAYTHLRRQKPQIIVRTATVGPSEGTLKFHPKLLPSAFFRRSYKRPLGRLATIAHQEPQQAVCKSKFIRDAVLLLALSAWHPRSSSATDGELPKNYLKFARKLLDALRESIEVDLGPANESEVRRKADPAKALVKEWVQNWRDARSISSEVSYRKITESLQLLGEFYLKKGQRSRLPQELGSDILRRLDAAAAALPLR